MGKTVIMLIVFGVMLLVVGIYLLYDKNKNKSNTGAAGQLNDSKDVTIKGVKKPEKVVEQRDMSGFIKFDKIANDMIYQNHGEKYTMVIQCKGINYELMSEIEQMAVEEGFITFLNTLKFPIQLYVQTRSVNLNDNITKYKQRVEFGRVYRYERGKKDGELHFVEEDLEVYLENPKKKLNEILDGLREKVLAEFPSEKELENYCDKLESKEFKGLLSKSPIKRARAKKELIKKIEISNIKKESLKKSVK